jgi:hypothetical protein
MSFLSWLRNLRPADYRRPTRRPARALRARPQLEALEERYLLSFSVAVSYPVGTAPQAVVTADLNHDGAPDLVTANRGTYDASSGTYLGGGSVSVLLGLRDKTGQPTGTFGAAQNYAIGSCVSVAVGDINGDGKPDIVTGNGGVLLGKGDGTFRVGASYSGGLGSYVSLADFNNDGKQDLITAAFLPGLPGSRVGYNKISVQLGNGDGTFQAGTTYTTPSYLVAVAIGDFNGDGKLDLITGTNTSVYAYQPTETSELRFLQGNGTVTLSLLPGNGNGTFGAAQPMESLSLASSDLEGLTVGDFTGDGKLDLAVAYGDYYANSTVIEHVTAYILPGNGDGTFYAGALNNPYGYFSSIDGGSAVGLAAADLNHDGVLDLITVGTMYTAGATVVDTLQSNVRGDQAVVASYFGSVSSPTAFVVGDFNGDGYADVAVVGQTSAGSYDVDVHLWSVISVKKKK